MLRGWSIFCAGIGRNIMIDGLANDTVSDYFCKPRRKYAKKFYTHIDMNTTIAFSHSYS